MDSRLPDLAGRLDAQDRVPRWTPTRTSLPVSRHSETGSVVPVAAVLIPFQPRALTSVGRDAWSLPQPSSSHPEPGTLPCSPRRPVSHRASARPGSRLAEGDTACLALMPARAAGARLRCPRRRARINSVALCAMTDSVGAHPARDPVTVRDLRCRSGPPLPSGPRSTVRTAPRVRLCVRRVSEQFDVATRLRRSPHRRSLPHCPPAASFATLAGAQEALVEDEAQGPSSYRQAD